MVWKEDKPVWMRLKDVNPVDILKKDSIDLRSKRYYFLIGDTDDFNYDTHLPVIKPLLQKQGAEVLPEKGIIPSGRHEWKAVKPYFDELFFWLNKELSSG